MHDRGRLPDGHLRRRPGRDQGRDGAARPPISDDERATLDRLGFAENTRMACCVRVTGAVERRAHAGQGGARRASAILDFNYDQRRQARRRDRQRDRGRHRRRPPPPPPSRTEDRPDRRGAPPPLQPHGHRRLVYGRSAMQGLYLTRTPGTTSARSPPGSTRARCGSTATNRRSRSAPARSSLRPADPRVRLAQLRPADRGLRRARAPACCATPPTRWRCAPTPSRSAPPRRRGGRRPARPRGRLRAAQARAQDDRAGAPGSRLLRRQLDQRGGEMLRTYLEGLGLEILVEPRSSRRRQRPPAGRRARRRPPAPGPDPARRRGHQPERRPRQGREPAHQPRRDRRRPHAHRRPDDLRCGRRRRAARESSRAVADRVAQAEVAAENAVGGDKRLRGRRAGHDPQGRRHRAHDDRAHRAPRTATRRSSTRTRRRATASS